MKYDKNGNITHLTRGGHLKEMPDWDKDDDFGTMDQLDYQYFDGSNRLRSVTDGISKNDTSGKGEFVDGNKDGDDYVYDPNGNMTQDLNKGIKGATLAEKGIEYNHLNLPTKVTVNNGNYIGTIDYTYTANGIKLKKKISTTGVETLYAGGYVYEGNTLQFFPHPEGYVSVENGNYNYVYDYLDHLGNIRLSYTDADGNGSIDPNSEIIQERNYYPFGLTQKGYNSNVSSLGNSVAKKYLFGGKEYQDELGLGWYDIIARNYDAALGRFMNPDPHSENYYSHSIYNYAFNNPILFIDPDGRDGIVSGKGTEDDPYVVTANYYYYGLNEDEAKGFNSAIDSYNNDGNAHKINTKDGKVFVKFNLTATESDNAEAASTAAEANTHLDENTGVTVRWGNTVTVGNVANTPGGDGLGNADDKHINLDRADIANSGQGVSRTSKGVSVHEIGHNLGGLHGDPGTIMQNLTQTTTTKQISTNGNSSSTSFSNPSVNKNGIRAIIGRFDSPQGYKDNYRNPPQRYLTEKEIKNIDTDGRTGKILIFTPKPN